MFLKRLCTEYHQGTHLATADFSPAHNSPPWVKKGRSFCGISVALLSLISQLQSPLQQVWHVCKLFSQREDTCAVQADVFGRVYFRISVRTCVPVFRRCFRLKSRGQKVDMCPHQIIHDS